MKDLGEKAKVSLRNIRRDANSMTDKEEKEKVISEDEQKNTRDEVDRLIKSFEKGRRKLPCPKCFWRLVS